ncbi:MAG: hypothetical protein AUJ49_12545 [Desulfovibrionaceae bacterium CG1_02_65_16]|nr:MAG: hypothetical protein AUJ49_12545 [Desulfovibrionaceae bacterium CG1_02_65_16]
MNKRIMRLLSGLVVGVMLFGSYEAYAYYQYVQTMHRALGSCSARVSAVLSHTQYDPANLEHTLRSISEAILYVDAMVDETSHPARFRNARSMRYMALCGETLRKSGNFAEAAQEYALAALSFAPGRRLGGPPDPKDVATREQDYNELMRRHAALRVQLTELYNENYDMRAVHFPLEELVDAGSIEHAQQEINTYYGRAR